MTAPTRSRLPFLLAVGAMVPLHAVGGCSPEYEVYSTSSCTQDADCSRFSVCESEVCQPCEALYEQCTQDCEFGWEITTKRRGDCYVCACLAEGSGGGGGNVGGSGAQSAGGYSGGGTAGYPSGGGTAGYPSGATAGIGAAPVGGAAAGGFLVGGGGASSCQIHGDCPAGSWCDDSVCAPCSGDPALDCEPCEPPGVPSFALTNDCEVCECLPPNECVDDATCAPGICAAGPLCEDGCPDLACCYGNTCVVP